MSLDPMPTATQKARVLVVDDDALIAMCAVDMLEDLGHEALSALSGAEALETLKRGETVDLLVTDLSMPGMGGAELAKVARDMRPGLPVLVTTGYGDARALPDESHRLAKPYTQRELGDAVQRALSHA